MLVRTREWHPRNRSLTHPDLAHARTRPDRFYSPSISLSLLSALLLLAPLRQRPPSYKVRCAAIALLLPCATLHFAPSKKSLTRFANPCQPSETSHLLRLWKVKPHLCGSIPIRLQRTIPMLNLTKPEAVDIHLHKLTLWDNNVRTTEPKTTSANSSPPSALSARCKASSSKKRHVEHSSSAQANAASWPSPNWPSKALLNALTPSLAASPPTTPTSPKSHSRRT